MIITELKQLSNVPIGEVVTLVLQFKVVEADMESPHICESCIFNPHACDFCGPYARPDGKNVEYVKI